MRRVENIMRCRFTIRLKNISTATFGRLGTELYDPLGMPADLADAHATLDRCFQACLVKRTFLIRGAKRKRVLGKTQR